MMVGLSCPGCWISAVSVRPDMAMQSFWNFLTGTSTFSSKRPDLGPLNDHVSILRCV